MRLPVRTLALLLVSCAAPAAAELPQPVRAMIDAAIATGDAAKVATVLELARQTNPAETAEIDALASEIALLEKQTRRTMVTESIAPRPIRVLNRGDWMDDKGEIVQPAVPAFLPTIAVTDRRLTRLDLERWLTSYSATTAPPTTTPATAPTSA